MGSVLNDECVHEHPKDQNMWAVCFMEMYCMKRREVNKHGNRHHGSKSIIDFDNNTNTSRS